MLKKNKYIYENVNDKNIKLPLMESDGTKGLNLGINDNEKLLNIFNDALLKNNYNIKLYF